MNKIMVYQMIDHIQCAFGEGANNFRQNQTFQMMRSGVVSMRVHHLKIVFIGKKISHLRCFPNKKRARILISYRKWMHTASQVSALYAKLKINLVWPYSSFRWKWIFCTADSLWHGWYKIFWYSWHKTNQNLAKIAWYAAN